SLRPPRPVGRSLERKSAAGKSKASKALAASEALKSFAMNRTAEKTSIDVIGVTVEVGAVTDVAEGVEHLRIDAVLDVVHRAVGEHGIHTGRVSRPKE